MFIKPLELNLQVCTSATSWLVDLKSTVLAYRGRAAKLLLTKYFQTEMLKQSLERRQI